MKPAAPRNSDIDGRKSTTPTGSLKSVGGRSMPLLEFEKPLAKMEQEIERLEAEQETNGRDYGAEISGIRTQLASAIEKTYANLTPWESVLMARHPRRPLLRDYLGMIAKDFCELHGDKLYGDDKALVTGFGRVGGHRVMLIGHQKGRETREKIEANFGCAHPEGYRKALQKMKIAEKFNIPIVCLIDTPGAYPGVGAEERGIASAIAVNLMEMSRLRTPVIAAVIGEGGSGGALGIAVADRIAVMQYAYYSVISPEGGAAILWKTGAEAPKAAEALRLTPAHLERLKLIDSIISEPMGGAHRDPHAAAQQLESWISKSLREVTRYSLDRLVERRYDRWRRMGSDFITATSTAEVEQAPAARSKSKAGTKAAKAATPNGVDAEVSSRV